MGDVVAMPKKRGRPRRFSTPEDFKEKYLKYVETIYDEEFVEVISYTGFAKFCGCAVQTVYNMLIEYPELKEWAAEPTADTLVVGAIKGKYKSTPAIFALKNRCGWADKVESTNVSSDKRVASKEEAEEKIKQLLERKRG